ncbi:MAG: phenylacetic acid degradation protein [Chloroflexi bacterium]|nr:phenylacetic acid degradation protein [Chloroflexota bacterium]
MSKMDSEWNRYEVFEKERVDLPHRNAGSVHAPDAEMALENARDLFVRRPNCLSLWVIPEHAIFAKTAQELQDDSWRDQEVPHNADSEIYLVFQKQGQIARETYVAHVGQVEASSPQAAMRAALETFAAKNVFVWWVVPERLVLKSEAQDAPSMFAPAHAKKYRMHAYYPVEPIMRELKSAQGMLESDG